MTALRLSWVDGAESLSLPTSAVDYTRDEICRREESVRRQLLGLGGGLLSVVEPTKHRHSHRHSSITIWRTVLKDVVFFHRTARDYLDTPDRRAKLEAQFPAFDSDRTHSLLRITEMVSTGLIFDDIVELFSWKYQQPHAHMKILETALVRKPEPRRQFIGIGSIHPLSGYASMTWDSGCESDNANIQLLQTAIACGQESYVRAELASSQAPMSLSEQINLLTSTMDIRSSAEMMGFLLEKGFSGRSLVELRNEKQRDWLGSIEGDTITRSFWIVFLADFSEQYWCWPNGKFKMHTFEKLERLLLVEDQEPVVLLGRTKEWGERFGSFITVEQLVLWFQPANTESLLALLRRWRTDAGDDGERPKVPWAPGKWQDHGVPDHIEPVPTDKVSGFSLEAVVSEREIITTEERWYYRVW